MKHLLLAHSMLLSDSLLDRKNIETILLSVVAMAAILAFAILTRKNGNGQK